MCVCFVCPQQHTQTPLPPFHHTPLFFTRAKHEPSHRKPGTNPLTVNTPLFFTVCDDALWALLNTPPGGQLRARPDFPDPVILAAGANSAARDAFKRATECRAALLACAAFFLLAILDSIVGEANRLAISDSPTDTLHLTPRGVIIAMTAFHGVMTGAEVEALRQPLKKKLSAVSDLPSHIVTFRGVLARLANAGQATHPTVRCVPFVTHPTVRCVPFVPCHRHPIPRFPAVYIIVYCGERGNCATDVRGLCRVHPPAIAQHLSPQTFRGQPRRVQGRSKRR